MSDSRTAFSSEDKEEYKTESSTKSDSTIKIVQALSPTTRRAISSINKAFDVKKVFKELTAANSERNAKVWVAKKSPSELIASCEVISQEGMRLLSLVKQPKTRFWRNGLKIGVISEKFPSFEPFTSESQCTPSFLFGFGLSTLLALFFNETDLKLEHFDARTGMKIDGDWSLSFLTNGAFAKNSEITEAEVSSLPYTSSYQANQWLDQIVSGRKMKLTKDSIFHGIETNSEFRLGVNLAILRIILMTDVLVRDLVAAYVGKDEFKTLIRNALVLRKNQVTYAASQNNSFKEFISSKKAEVDVPCFLQRLREFRTSGKYLLVEPADYPEIKRAVIENFKKTRSLMNQFLPRSMSRSSNSSNSTEAVHDSAKKNRRSNTK